MANTNVLSKENLKKLEAAQNSRAARKTKSCRGLQHGGLMYASEGREMSKTRAEVELEKAQGRVRHAEKQEEKKKKDETGNQKKQQKAKKTNPAADERMNAAADKHKENEQGSLVPEALATQPKKVARGQGKGKKKQEAEGEKKAK